MAASLQALVKQLRAGDKPSFSPEAKTLEYARSLDAQDELAHFRDQFIIPTKKSLKKTALDGTIPGMGAANGHSNGHSNGNNDKDADADADAASIYFAGNSLGVQPKCVRRYVDAQLETWASVGVGGHFTDLGNSPLPNWMDVAEKCARQFAPIVGAAPEEIVVMSTLSVNLHLLMASFYRPTEKRHKILVEWKPFPSDWYIVQSQITHHNLDPAQSLVEIQPDDESGTYISTEAMLAAIDAHADSAALLLLPGIQYYSGQYFDMARITAHARARGLVVGWDLAHAVGNVELRLHDWDIDFAVWCTYKYINAGPGSIGGAFVHERYGHVSGGGADFRPRLEGWYGNEKGSRMQMEKPFRPTPGAAGYQVSNPSALDLASLLGALEPFGQTSMRALRDKALALTAYLEFLLDGVVVSGGGEGADPLFTIVTPRNPHERGCQLSLMLLRDDLLAKVTEALVQAGIVCDKRKPGVVRVSPVPMYSRFEDVWRFIEVFGSAIRS